MSRLLSSLLPPRRSVLLKLIGLCTTAGSYAVGFRANLPPGHDLFKNLYRGGVFALLLAGGLTATKNAHAYSLSSSRLPKSSTIDVVFRIGAGNSIGLKAASRWNEILKGSTRLHASKANGTTELYGNGLNDIVIERKFQGKPFAPDVTFITQQRISMPGTQQARVTEIDIHINEAEKDFGSERFQGICLAALGTILGLEDPWEHGQVGLASVMAPSGSGYNDLQYDDSLAVAALFGGPVVIRPDGTMGPPSIVDGLRQRLTKLRKALRLAMQMDKGVARTKRVARLRLKIRHVRSQIQAAA